MLDDVRFALIAIEGARREVFCNPGHVAALRALVDELGMVGVVTVKGSPYVPLGQGYVIDRTRCRPRSTWRSTPAQAPGGGSSRGRALEMSPGWDFMRRQLRRPERKTRRTAHAWPRNNDAA